MRGSQEWEEIKRTGTIPREILEHIADSGLKGTYKIREITGKQLLHDGSQSQFNYSKWLFLASCPYTISNKCCDVMKKSPAHFYQKKTGRNPITAQMASESKLRTQNWLRHGCNAFDAKTPISNPMSFWTEQDVLLYIYTNIDDLISWRKKEYMNNLRKKGFHSEDDIDAVSGLSVKELIEEAITYPIASVYGEIAKESGTDGQIDWADLELFDIGVPVLKTTGCDRTGCMFCGFGCHLESSPNRFERMKQTHPQLYEYIMKPWNEGGLGYKDVIDWINKHGNLFIRY